MYDTISDKKVKNALHFLKRAQLQNHSELKHIMYLGNHEGFANEDTVHVSDVFQRALLNDCLIDVSERYSLNASAFLDRECDYLIEQRNIDAIGGWSYFPSVREIAADIDDLGQMIQLFIKSGNKHCIENYCKTAINLALSDRLCPNGGIETWIIPKDNKTHIQQEQEMFSSTKWGRGPDLEVMANFCYALYLYDSFCYEPYIKPAIAYIVNNQNEQGFWESRWYYGNYYGTYVCLRLLQAYKEKYAIDIQKGLEYIFDEQRADGGFSLTRSLESDPLSTAFAILALRLFFNPEHQTVRKATAYLKKSQEPDGCWKAVDFIKPKAKEPYKSKTMTTAFVLKALSTTTDNY